MVRPRESSTLLTREFKRDTEHVLLRRETLTRGQRGVGRKYQDPPQQELCRGGWTSKRVLEDSTGRRVTGKVYGV